MYLIDNLTTDAVILVLITPFIEAWRRSGVTGKCKQLNCASQKERKLFHLKC